MTNSEDAIGPGKSIMLGLLALALLFCGVHAILADSVTTPARFGGDHRVHGMDTVLVGVDWILMSGAVGARVAFDRRGRYRGSVLSVGLAVLGGLFWFAAI